MLPAVTLLLEGLHGHDHANIPKGLLGLVEPVTSSCTLVVGQSVTIVDTGTPAFVDSIIQALTEKNLCPSDVEYVLLTHRHLDHCQNCGMFKNARLVVEAGNVVMAGSRAEIYSAPYEHNDWSIFDTSGHTVPHYSVRVTGLWKGKRQRIVIAGDAIREDLVRNGYYRSNKANPAECSSALRVLEDADVVIPGHYQILTSVLIEELCYLLKE